MSGSDLHGSAGTESDQTSTDAIETDILTLDDIVWRSPASQVVDSTEIITHLAEEADRVANGTDTRPPPAAILPRRESYPNAGNSEPEVPTPDQEHRRAPRFQSAAESFSVQSEELADVENSIRGQITATLKAQGAVDANGKVNISEEELRRMVRAHIDAWLKQQSGATR